MDGLERRDWRQGLGNVRHLDTHTLWIQQAVRCGRIEIKKVLGEQNPADILTKHSITRDKLMELVKLYDCTYLDGRPESAPQMRRGMSSKVTMADGGLDIGGTFVPTSAEPNPANLPWQERQVDVVFECTGIFTARDKAQAHLDAGAHKVIISAPASGADATICVGVNDETLDAEQHHVVSNASCTTNCLAPMAKVLHEAFGIELGVINTIHAYTNDQRLADVPHSDWRRSRAAAENVIPTTTGAARAVGKVLPELNGKLDGIAMRVPVPDGSVVDFNVRLEQDVTLEKINDAVHAAAESGPLAKVLEYSTLPVVSTDIIGNEHSSIYDAPFTRVIGGNFIKTLNWYDNEWGYSNRVVDLMGILNQFV